MILAIHTIVGLGLTSLLPAPVTPVAAFAVSIAGHYLTDMIPHWEYNVPFLVARGTDKKKNTLVWGKPFLLGLSLIGSEFLLGIIGALFLFYSPGKLSWETIVASIIGSVLPDVLQFFYFLFRRQPWNSIQKFHDFFHSCYKIEKASWGILAQVLIVAVVVCLVSMAN